MSEDTLPTAESVFSEKFLEFASKVHSFGGNVIIAGESATCILLHHKVDVPEVALAWDTDIQDVGQPAPELLHVMKSAIDAQICTADSTLRETFETGSAHTIKAFEKLLGLRSLNVDAIGLHLTSDSEFVLLDDTNVTPDILKKQLGPTASGHAEGTDIRLHERAVRLAARYGLQANEQLRSVLYTEARVWSSLLLPGRGALLRDVMASESPSSGLILMYDCGILNRAFPRLHDMVGTEEMVVEGEQGKRKYHHKDVFFHTMQVLDNVCEISENVWLRFAALLHDVAKPRTKAFAPETGWTFHGHAEIGARMVKKMFREYEYTEEQMRYVRKLVALHLRPMALVSEGVTDSAVRRLITDVGDEMEDLLTLCRCDITSKNPGKVTRYLSNYDRLVETIHDVLAKDRLREWQPPITGQEIMEHCGIPPGITVGILKTRVENAILAGEIENSPEAALEYLFAIKDEVLESANQAKPASRKQAMKTLPDNLEK